MSTRLHCKFMTAALLASFAVAAPAARGAEFTLFIYESPAEFAKRTDPKAGPAYWKAFAEYAESLKAAGILRGGMPLMDATDAKVVSVAAGKTKVGTGTLAKSKDVLGGFFMIDVADRDAAVAWAAKAPAALTGAIEVRAAFPAPPMR